MIEVLSWSNRVHGGAKIEQIKCMYQVLYVSKQLKAYVRQIITHSPNILIHCFYQSADRRPRNQNPPVAHLNVFARNRACASPVLLKHFHDFWCLCTNRRVLRAKRKKEVKGHLLQRRVTHMRHSLMISDRCISVMFLTSTHSIPFPFFITIIFLFRIWSNKEARCAAWWAPKASPSPLPPRPQRRRRVLVAYVGHVPKVESRRIQV